LIFCAFERIAAQFIDTVPDEVQLAASTLEYTVFTNYMDSHLWFDDAGLSERYEKWRRL
jgi:hypothetical protein